MASQVQLSASIRSNLLLLQTTQTSLDRTQTRLSTGNKVNSALDGPKPSSRPSRSTSVRAISTA
jgi:flagellin-like hook-associated protein FlgL